jgi:hypothetical protein
MGRAWSVAGPERASSGAPEPTASTTPDAQPVRLRAGAVMRRAAAVERLIFRSGSTHGNVSSVKSEARASWTRALDVLGQLRWQSSSATQRGICGRGSKINCSHGHPWIRIPQQRCQDPSMFAGE